jgi:signal transduction histidine kinase
MSVTIGNAGAEEVWVDRFRIVQVFRNIFENALAACEDPAEIKVTCRETTFDEKSFVEIRVADNGPGIPPKDRARLFEPFFTTKAKGTGLGMAIAQRVIEVHGGRISVEESAKHGAEFIIALPKGSR